MKRYPKPKIGVAAVLSHCCAPRAVITATLRGAAKYVYLRQEEIDYIEVDLLRKVNRDWSHLATVAELGAQPAALRESAIAPESDEFRRHWTEESDAEVTGRHISGRGNLWVNVRLAAPLLVAFSEWQRNHAARSDCIWAPNWQVLTGVRTLAAAAGRLAEVRSSDPALATGVR